MKVWSDNLSYNLIWLRKHYGISKRQMAYLLHISVGSINKIERGELPPNLNVDFLFLILKYFHIRPNELLYRQIDGEP